MPVEEFLTLLKSKLTFADVVPLPPDDILMSEINNAIGAINHRRDHTASVDAPLAPGYDRFVVEMAKAVLLKTGAEGQTGHTENGTARNYGTDGQYPLGLLRQIIWKVR